MCANLLLHLESFAWQDLTLNRSDAMNDLILAVDKADEWEDVILGHPDAYNPHLGWGTMNDLLFCSEEEYKIFTGGWFTNDHQKILLKLWRNPTPGNARTLTELEEEPLYRGANNGLMGCYYQPVPNKMVYNNMSLISLHQNFVWYTPALRKTAPAYFYRHYIPALREPAEQIRKWIRQHPSSWFERLDTPVTDQGGQVLHKGQVEMHFKDERKSCLYIGGTWKHGGFEIPEDTKDQLESWGFLIPIDQR